MRRWKPLQEECGSDYYLIGSTTEEVCCFPSMEKLYYNQGAIPPGDAGNPLYLYGCGDTLFTGYIDGPYQVTNGIIDYGTIIVCPICPQPCECFIIEGDGLLINASWTDCCENEESGFIMNGERLCIKLNRDGSPRIQFNSSGAYYTATGNPCACGESCGR